MKLTVRLNVAILLRALKVRLRSTKLLSLTRVVTLKNRHVARKSSSLLMNTVTRPVSLIGS